ncbi:uncharacterized protein LOC121971133 isoform X1 [Zingiber officinale]|uniref:uncharacterized protein LOC121971133 isoform X1 n=1 Tax=Zingiber officinale TaxID=94328 RepID=UPI001C4BFD8F|nr:uncharacterized protein LOC121971133 isoform X1 [Zingiber officinale]
MSAVVCGKRSSSIFDELLTPPPASKRVRCSAGSSSPTPSLRLSPFRISNPLDLGGYGEDLIAPDNLSHLKFLFPDMDQQLLKQALEASGNDLDSAIKSLNDLRLDSSYMSLVSAVGKSENGTEMNGPLSSKGRLALGTLKENGVDIAGAADASLPSADVHPTNEWVDLFVREMMNASDIDDARARASRALEFFEKSIMDRTSAEVLPNLQKENVMLKEQVEILLRENSVLKRAVSIQHERQKEFEERSQELQHLKQLVAQYQEQVRTLEINNYALTVHLRQAQQGSSMPGRYNPDVF